MKVKWTGVSAALLWVLAGCSSNTIEPVANLEPAGPLPVAIWVYAEDDDYRTRDLVRSVQMEIRKREDLTSAQKSSDITLALSRNTILPERYGADAFSVQVRLLVNGVPRDRFGSQCSEPRDERCTASILRNSIERYEVIAARLDEQFPDEPRD